MRIISKGTLRDYWQGHAETEQPLKSWHQIANKANWGTPQDVKSSFVSASIIADNRVVFDIHGNDYRLIVKFNYAYKVGYVRFIGTHKEYDKVDATTV
jgi:mRNA interferase HigB